MTRLIIFRILFFLTLVTTFTAHADETQPSPTPAALSANTPIECFLLASELGLTSFQKIQLCAKSTSTEPVGCFHYFFSRQPVQPHTPAQLLTIDQKVRLCQEASSPAPTACFEETFDLLLSFDERISLCRKADFGNIDSPHPYLLGTAPVHCFRRSFKFPLSPDQRIHLCSQANSDDPVLCLSRSNFLGLSLDQRVQLCTQL